VARTPLDLDELVEHWTLLRDEQALVSGKPGATRLGFTVPLKFCTQYGRFPRGRAELPGEAVPALDMGFYDWTGRTVEYHRAQIREHFGFRQCSVANAEKLTTYLAEHIADKEHRPEQVRVARSSYSTALSMPSAECLCCRLWTISRRECCHRGVENKIRYTRDITAGLRHHAHAPPSTRSRHRRNALILGLSGWHSPVTVSMPVTVRRIGTHLHDHCTLGHRMATTPNPTDRSRPAVRSKKPGQSPASGNIH